MYDVETADGTGQAEPAHIRVWYDRHGKVTSWVADASSVAERAAEVLGLTDIGRQGNIDYPPQG
jgi:hypothetical protein